MISISGRDANGFQVERMGCGCGCGSSSDSESESWGGWKEFLVSIVVVVVVAAAAAGVMIDQSQ